ncbi:MAG: hypothetical protein NZM31_07550, partial [Gemmatales bacterium]|nr:hypothetical protein [Gemmatales bacterium]MDW8386850.1 hypothetical protein [Gemmatales bacterium]
MTKHIGHATDLHLKSATWINPGVACVAFLMLLGIPIEGRGQESIWIEAEHLRGVRGHCFPDVNGQKTAGNWAFSGPGIAGEWTQGGESGWLSIACGPEDDKAEADYACEIPVSGTWRLWVRYRDWRQRPERFVVRVEQPNMAARSLVYGERPVIDEDDELKLLWDWAFGWDVQEIELVKGPARIVLISDQIQDRHRQIDCLCLTTDRGYRPYHREKPRQPAWEALEQLRGSPELLGASKIVLKAGINVSESWNLKSFRNRGFLYLWNVGKPWLDELASQEPTRIRFPFHVDEPLLEEFRRTYAGRSDLPIFSDPRIVPVFHASGPHILDNSHFV